MKKYKLNTVIGNYKIGDEVTAEEISKLLNIKPCIECGWLIPLPVSEPVKERGKVTGFKFQTQDILKCKNYYEFRVTSEIPENKFPFIEMLIEAAINDEFQVHSDMAVSVHSQNKKLFTESEVDAIRADTWKAARKATPLYDQIKYEYFDLPEYISSLNTNEEELRGSLNISNNQEQGNDAGKEASQFDLQKIALDYAIDNYTDKNTATTGEQRRDVSVSKKSFMAGYNFKSEQPTNDNAFVWTDDLVADFIFDKHWTDTPYPHIYKFKKWKQSKQSAPVDNIVRHVYNSMEFETNAGEKLFLCMRDSGFEIKYADTLVEFKEGKFIPHIQTEQGNVTIVKNELGFDYYLQDGTRLCKWSSYERLFDQLQDVLKNKYENKSGKTALAIDLAKGSIEEARQLGLLWQKFQPTVINAFLPERKIDLPKDFISIKSLAAINGDGKKVSIDEMLKEFFKQPLQFFTPDNDIEFSLKDFIEKFVGKNTLIRLWYKCGSGHHPILDNPKMEWEISKGEFANRKVLYVKDILVLDSNHKEALNIVIEEQPEQKKRPLFTTEDGVEITENSTKIWVVDIKDFQLWSANAISRSCDARKKYFSCKDAAKQYIVENKPCMSVVDLAARFPLNKEQKDGVIKLAKEKIKYLAH